jgi:hypothetical protein
MSPLARKALWALAALSTTLGVAPALAHHRARLRLPQTRIVTTPVRVSGSTATIRFTATPHAAGYRCSIDRGPWKTCHSPEVLRGLSAGAHHVRVRAHNRHGSDRTPAQVVVVVPQAPASLAPDAKAPAAASVPAAPGVPTLPAVPAVPAVPSVPLPAGVLFRDDFSGPDGVITNHYAMWSGDSAAHQSSNYQVESGTLYRQNGVATTGAPTYDQPWTVDSTDGSGNDIFRDWTRESDFGDVSVTMQFRFEDWSAGQAPDWPAKSWDGVKIWLRRQGPSGSWGLYTAEIARRQGNVMIQKKCTGSDDYTMLAQTPANLPPQTGAWETDGGTVKTNADGSVTITVIRDGQTVLSATDTGNNGCAPITTPGRVGVRGDNAQFSFDDLTVSSLS